MGEDKVQPTGETEAARVESPPKQPPNGGGGESGGVGGVSGGAAGTAGDRSGGGVAAGDAAAGPALAFSDVVNLYHRQLDAVHKLWGYHGLIAAGLVTIVWTKDVPMAAIPLWVITGLFLVFAVFNGALIVKEQGILKNIGDVIEKGHKGEIVGGRVVPENLRPALAKLTTSSPIVVVAAVAVLVVILIWLRYFSAQPATPAPSTGHSTATAPK
jgi:hypothetical protein